MTALVDVAREAFAEAGGEDRSARLAFLSRVHTTPSLLDALVGEVSARWQRMPVTRRVIRWAFRGSPRGPDREAMAIEKFRALVNDPASPALTERVDAELAREARAVLTNVIEAGALAWARSR